MSQPFDWNDLRYFLSCARTGSLAGAGRMLRVDQTTAGRRLAALEAALGAKLFERTSDGFVLTATGERLWEAAQRVEQGAIDLERLADGADARLEGTVRVTTTETLAVSFLVRNMVTLRRAHPGIVLELIAGHARADLLKRDADLAVRVGKPPEQQSLIIRKLGTFEWGLFASKDYLRGRAKRAPRRSVLDGHDLVGYCEEPAQSAGSKWLEEQGKGATVVLRTNSFLAASRAAAAGWGVAMLPLFAAETEADLVRITRESYAPVDLWLIVHADLQRAARVRAVIDHLARAVREGVLNSLAPATPLKRAQPSQGTRRGG